MNSALRDFWIRKCAEEDVQTCGDCGRDIDLRGVDTKESVLETLKEHDSQFHENDDQAGGDH